VTSLIDHLNYFFFIGNHLN